MSQGFPFFSLLVSTPRTFVPMAKVDEKSGGALQQKRQQQCISFCVATFLYNLLSFFFLCSQDFSIEFVSAVVSSFFSPPLLLYFLLGGAPLEFSYYTNTNAAGLWRRRSGCCLCCCCCCLPGQSPHLRYLTTLAHKWASVFLCFPPVWLFIVFFTRSY